MPPRDSDDEPLEEIEDDAIVAQQAAAHAPAPRVPIAQDARTIVVDEGATAGDTTRLRAIPRRPMDPTLVVRAVRPPVFQAAPPSSPMPVPQARGTPSWLPWVIWVCAGVVALLLGGVLALVANRRDAQPAAQPAPPPSAAKPIVTK